MIKIISKEKNSTSQLTYSITNILNDLPVGYTKLSRCPEIICAVDKIADLVSNMTIMLMENSESGDVRIHDGLSRKLDIDPCEGMTRKQWMFHIVRTLLLDGDGNAVIIPEFTQEGFIKNLRPVPATHFSINTSSDFRQGYKIQIDDKEYDPTSLIHFVINPSMENPYRGQSYRIQLKDLAKTLKAGEETKQDYMSNKSIPNLIIRFDGDDEEFLTEEGRQRIFNQYFGSQKAGAPWIIPDIVTDIKEIKPLTLNDIAINDSLKADKEMIAALLGVPAFMLGIGEFNKAEYNNFIKDKVLSIAKVIEQTLTRSILKSAERYFKFNIRSLYAYDMTTLSNVGSTLFNQGILTGNEVRDWIGLPPMEGLDELIRLENYIPGSETGNQSKLVDTSETEGEE